jgi:site-specific recombinase XerC
MDQVHIVRHKVLVEGRSQRAVARELGLRMSELVGLQLGDVTLEPQATVLVHGKGRRERCLPVWKVTATALRA